MSPGKERCSSKNGALFRRLGDTATFGTLFSLWPTLARVQVAREFGQVPQAAQLLVFVPGTEEQLLPHRVPKNQRSGETGFVDWDAPRSLFARLPCCSGGSRKAFSRFTVEHLLGLELALCSLFSYAPLERNLERVRTGLWAQLFSDIAAALFCECFDFTTQPWNVNFP